MEAQAISGGDFSDVEYSDSSGAEGPSGTFGHAESDAGVVGTDNSCTCNI